MLRKLLFMAVLAGLVGILAPSCKVSYSFTGANLSPEVKTFTVYYFPNRARLINPTLSQSFTEEMREKLTRQTSLNELSESGDLEFEGQITGYEFRPMSVQKEDVSAQTRLTVTINVKYTNNKVPEDNFEQSFSAYEDFDSNLSISSVEEDLSAEIIEKLTEDIFNATIANW
ncbi:LptE family protein [Draconibacterium halophilum]|uniref:LptE family protein n=1 Tax=Draconibacterium halophilum TaxID=2706887 RepID=A0A6C0RHI2_9BACT|nr:LptE family protein [Draconibacterium halophilum]QIA09559.1 LptE family protein [Draconibacterium halophilum]